MSDEVKKDAPKEVGLQIHLDEKVAEGVYTNLALINHTDMDFTIDFLYVQPQAPKAIVRSRVITSPVHMKRFMLALQENVRRYEQRHGEIGIAAPAEVTPKGTYN
jgi:hypothetical protein